MALPEDVSTFTLTFGAYTDATGAPAFVGQVGKLKPVGRVTHVASGAQILPTPLTVTIEEVTIPASSYVDEDGETVQVSEHQAAVATLGPIPHSDDPTLAGAGFKTGFLYDLQWQVASSAPSPGNKRFAVPQAMGDTVDYDLLVPSTVISGVLVPVGVGPQGLKGDPGAADDASVAALVPGPGATATALSAIFAAARDALPVTSTAAEINDTGSFRPVLFMDRNGNLLRGGTTSGNVLERSSNGGTTWTTVATLPRLISGLRQLDNGELLLTTTDDFPTNTVKSALHVTAGYPGSGTVTTTKVLEADNYGQSLGLAWGFGGGNGIYAVSEYDNKSPGSRSAVQRAWLTTDSFATPPSPIYDHGNGSTSTRHIHGVAYDKYRDAIIVTLGDYTGGADGDRRIRVSWDRAATWQTVSTKYHPTVIIPRPDCWLFGTDNAPNGVLRIDRPSPTNLRVDVAYEISDYVNSTSGQPSTSHIAEFWFQGSGPGDPVLMPFSVAATGQYGLVLATTDGYAFEEVWRSALPYAAGASGPRRAIGPTPDGRILIAGLNGTTAWHTEVPAPVPGITSAVAKVARSLARAVPRRSYIALANSPGQPIPTGSTTWTELNLSLGAPTFVDDPGDLFTPSPDGKGVIVNRNAVVRIEIDSAMSGGGAFTAPRVGISVNGIRLTQTADRNISKTMWVRAGWRVVGVASHTSASSVNNDNGTTYGMVLDATETY